MNERIEQLLEKIQVNEHIECIAKQAGCTIDRIGYGEGNLEKFAELILKAAFDAVINDGRFHDAKGIIKAGKYTAMEHFGVEE